MSSKQAVVQYGSLFIAQFLNFNDLFKCNY